MRPTSASLLIIVWTTASVTANDGYTEIAGGWLDGNWVQVGYQLAWCCACWGWCVAYVEPFFAQNIKGTDLIGTTK